MGKVSFDFDDTIDRFDVQVFANSLVNKGYDVYIVTARPERYIGKFIGVPMPTNDAVFKVAEDVGIKTENIIFTAAADKINYLAGKGFLFHLDDSDDELSKIRDSEDSCYPMSVDFADWESHLKEKFKL